MKLAKERFDNEINSELTLSASIWPISFPIIRRAKLKVDLMAVKRLTGMKIYGSYWIFVVVLFMWNGKDKDLAAKLAEWKGWNFGALLDLFLLSVVIFIEVIGEQIQRDKKSRLKIKGEKWRKETGKSDLFWCSWLN